MKREYILGVLFFGGVWGLTEAVLGGALYAAQAPYASVPLTIMALAVLTLARSYLPRRGTGTLIAACAMLYKFLNSPFFGCHLLGILLTGACYDLVFDVLKIRSKSWAAAAVTYLSYAAFAVTITYLFRYNHWVQGGFTKVLRHIFIEGSVAALACACIVPWIARPLFGVPRLRGSEGVFFRLKAVLRTGGAWYAPYDIRSAISGGVSALTLGLWAFAVVMCLSSYPFVW